ncbi:MAG TPA: tetratricopeptide repeat protein [Kofleriaceae bacterium]|nr:tetratricopeptide repeat protein [Kofleriaceae bacterium]
METGDEVDVQADSAFLGAAVPAVAVMPAGPKLLHITHARQDEAWVHGVLLPALGLAEGQFWTRAEDDLGALRLEELERAVESCRYTLLVASGAARADQWAQFAGLLAEHLGVEEGKPRLLVVTRDFEPGSERAKELLPLRQRCLACLDCSDPERTAAALATLAAQLALSVTGEAPVECPYPGLRTFGAGDPGSCFDRPDLFFGRDAEGRAIVDQLRATGRVLLVGPSGCGKSSLMRARVLPMLESGADAMAVAPVRPDTDADGALRAVLESLDPQLAAATDAYLAAAGEPDAQSAVMAVAPWPRRLIYVDQFEEVFLDDGEDHASRAVFFARLSALARMPGVALLLGMRADFYSDLMRSPVWDDFKDHRVELTPLRGAALREAIARPAERVGVHVEADLIERLVREAEQDRASEALPLLQVALEQLWSQREWRYLSLASYARITEGDRHGLDAVLARHADASIAALLEPLQVLARRVLIDLVHLGEGRPDTRRRRSSSELRRAGDDTGALDEVLAHLSARRLIAVGAEATSPAAARGAVLASAEPKPGVTPVFVERHVDLAHDTLITGWPALAGWVASRRDDLRTQRRLEARAATGGLLAASELPEFTRWVAWLDTPAGQALGATEVLRALVRRSVAARRLRRGTFGVGLTGAVTFAIVFGLQTVELRDERSKTQRSISKAAETAEMVVADVDQGLRPVAGASGVREKVLKRARELLAELRKLGNLAEKDQRTVTLGRLAEADFYFERGRLEEARSLYQDVLADAQRRVSAEPERAQWQRDLSVSYGKLGDVAIAAGQLESARTWFERARAVSKDLATKEPNNTKWQRDLSVSYDRLGEVAVATGQLDVARAWLEQSLAIRKNLATSDPDHADWQSALSASYDYLGIVADKAGQLDAARTWFEQSLAVRKALAAKDPDHADWQRGLSISYNILGDLTVKAGELAVAHAWFEQALAVSKALTAKDPNNTDWQRDLSASYSRLGDVADKAGQFDVARAWFEQTLAVSKALTAKAPSNTDWQRDIAASYYQLGSIAIKAGQLDVARAWFEQALDIRKNLAAKDPNNAVWQHDLSDSFGLLGRVAVMTGRLDAARAWFEQALANDKPLTAKFPDNAEWQWGLSVSYMNLGSFAATSGQLAVARAWFERARGVLETLTTQAPSNTVWQRELSVAYYKLGEVAVKADQLAAARDWFKQALAISNKLAAKDPVNADWQHDLAGSYGRLGEIAIKTGQHDTARAWLEQALTINETLAAAEGSSAQARYDLMESHLKLASVLPSQPKRAARHIERAAEIHEQLRHAGAFASDPEFARIGERIRQLRGP